MIKCFRYSFFASAICFSILGLFIHSYNYVLIGMMSLFLNNICYACEDLNKRILFLIFHITFFTFLLSSPLISAFEGKKWWVIVGVSDARFALLSIGISLLFIYIGALMASEYIKRKSVIKRVIKHSELGYKKEFYAKLQLISSIVFYISSVFYLLQEVEKLTFMRGKDYLLLYTTFQSQLPSIVHTVASFMKYALCIYLATLPTKRKTVIPLAVFLASALPSLIVGIRNPIMLNSVFVFAYYFIRDILKDEKKWIGKIEKSILVISTPFILVFMAAYSDIRRGSTLAVQGIVSLFVQFFYGQGVTFAVLMMGYRAIPHLPQRQIQNYTFGGIIDYLLHGTLGQKFFGTMALPEGNNLINALVSNDFSHNMSYASLKEEYLAGKGWGSSYLLETYADYGYIGVLLFSLILGILLVWGIELIKKNALLRCIVLVSLTELFFIPRASATGWLVFLFTLQFWACVIFCYLIAGLCVKTYERKKGEKLCSKILE